jgi:quinoprotein glucose dehydrogenase
VKPPYGRITAINMDSGDHVFQIANADTPNEISSNRLLQGIDIPRTGVPTRSGVFVTKTLLFSGEGGGGPWASPIFRAHDKMTGEILAEIELPNNQTGQPFTYEANGKQYIAMFVGGSGSAAELVAYALP